MNATSFVLSFRKFAWVSVVLILGLTALTLPWLTVNRSVSNGATAVEGRPDAGSASRSIQNKDGDEGGSADERRAQLVLTPAPTPAGPKLASSAPAFTAPAPDPASVLALEEKLAALSYMMGPKNGVLDPGDRAGLTAFQKVEKLPLTGEPDPATLTRLDSAQRPAPLYSTPPEHLEVDIARQVVFRVLDGRVAQTLPTSTGNGKVFRSQGRRSRAVTPNGQFAITYKRNGWRRSPLGMLYRPAYFNGGIAFHGAKSVPTFPASHGCVRLPMDFADWFATDASHPGTVVYVYGNPGKPNPAPVAAAGSPFLPPPPPETGAAPPPSDEAAYQPPDSSPPEGSSPLLGGFLGRS